MKKLFCWLLALALCLSLFPAAALAEEPAGEDGDEPSAGIVVPVDPDPSVDPEAQQPEGDEIQAIASGDCGDSLIWSLSDAGVLTIAGTGDMWDWDMLTAALSPWNDHRDEIVTVRILSGVTNIGAWAFNGCSSLTSVTIPEGVTSIGGGAFSGCSSLTSVTIPEGVTSIRGGTFSRCSELMSVEIPASVICIEEKAFCRCYRLSDIWFGASMTDWQQLREQYHVYDRYQVVVHCADGDLAPADPSSCGDDLIWTMTSEGFLTIAGTGEMWDYCLFEGSPWDYSMVESVSIVSGVTSIGAEAFRDCFYLKDVAIPESVTRIGWDAFGCCSGLTSITIPKSVTRIEDSAFFSCDSLTGVTIPESVKNIGGYAFSYCRSLTEIRFDGAAPTIGAYAFDGVTATAYYPANDPTWTEEVRQDYGGTITWVVYTPEVPGIPIDEEHFPDPNFRSYVAERFDPDGDGLLSEEERLAVTYIDVPRRGLTSLEGIALFPALTDLDCGGNQLTVLDLSQNPALTRLYCDGNQLTALDLSQNPALTDLRCGSNQLTALDLSRNPALTRLWCGGNQLTALDLSQNPELETLYCYINQLTALDVSHNPALETLLCNYNQLTALDVSQNPALETLYCGDNQLTALDLSQNPALMDLECGGNQLTALDLSHNPALTNLDCSRNPLTALDLSHNPALNVLYCYNNQIPSLDLRPCPELLAVSQTEPVGFPDWGEPYEGVVGYGQDMGGYFYYRLVVDETTRLIRTDADLRIPGDINGDGKVNMTDVALLATYVKARGTGVDIVPDSGDVSGDGKVNMTDVALLATYVKARGQGVVIH